MGIIDHLWGQMLDENTFLTVYVVIQPKGVLLG